MIEVQQLTKRYGPVEALRGITTSIGRGEIVGLLGPNGAGKTTTMKILTGYILPTSGSATIAGWNVIDNPLEVQQRIGYLPENAPIYHDMLVQEYLLFTANIRGLAPRALRTRAAEVIADCRIGDVLTRPIGELSKGYRQRVGLAAAIVHDPDILILDEPTNGLDPNQIVEVRELIRRMGESKTIIISTHILPEVEATCGRAVILIDGRIRADGTLAELTKSHTQVVTIAPPDAAIAREALEKIAGVTRVDHSMVEGGFIRYRLQLSDGRDVAEAVSTLAREKSWPLRELRRDDRTLEQVFRELTETPAEVAA